MNLDLDRLSKAMVIGAYAVELSVQIWYLSCLRGAPSTAELDIIATPLHGVAIAAFVVGLAMKLWSSRPGA